MANRTINKYPVFNKERLLDFNEEFIIKIPKGAEVLCVQMQNDAPQIWAIVDPNAEEEERKFLLAGTGWDQDLSKYRYVGTFQALPFVWHLFENK